MKTQQQIIAIACQLLDEYERATDGLKGNDFNRVYKMRAELEEYKETIQPTVDLYSELNYFMFHQWLNDNKKTLEVFTTPTPKEMKENGLNSGTVCLF